MEAVVFYTPAVLAEQLATCNAFTTRIHEDKSISTGLPIRMHFYVYPLLWVIYECCCGPFFLLLRTRPCWWHYQPQLQPICIAMSITEQVPVNHPFPASAKNLMIQSTTFTVSKTHWRVLAKSHDNLLTVDTCWVIVGLANKQGTNYN